MESLEPLTPPEVAPSSPSSPRQGHRQLPGIVHCTRLWAGNLASAAERIDDLWSCLVTLFTFCFFACLILMLGVYGSSNIALGPHSSRLLQASSIFVQHITVRSNGESEHEPVMLYGMPRVPPLDVETNWSETYNELIPANSHKEWIYDFNAQAQINISYAVKSNTSQPLVLVIAQGSDDLSHLVDNPSHSAILLYWNPIHGNGVIQQNFVTPSDYYIAVGNPSGEDIEVKLDFSIQNLMYDTTGAYYKCSLLHSSCVLDLFFLRGNVAVLTTSSAPQQQSSHEWNVRVSYGPRWITYFLGSGSLTVTILLAFKLLSILLVRRHGDGSFTRQQNANSTATRRPGSHVFEDKNDDGSSLGSSYDSASYEEEDDEESEGDAENHQRSLCLICCNVRRNSFFLPCGHCATCIACGTRIVEDAGACPICRRKTKKVKKIFIV